MNSSQSVDLPDPVSLPALFPLFLKLSGRRVLLVGGGKVAAAKLSALLEAHALVTVVAPDVASDLCRPDVEILRRRFLPADLDGVWLVVAASARIVNREVAAAAEARRVFVIAVDDPQAGSAYTGGVLRRGGVTIAVSTDGHAPALAGLIREGLEAVIPDGLDIWLAKAKELRAEWRSHRVPFDQRRPLLLDALNQIYVRPASLP